jgi:hypothetical protein
VIDPNGDLTGIGNGNHDLFDVVRVDHAFGVAQHESTSNGEAGTHMEPHGPTFGDVERQLGGNDNSVSRLDVDVNGVLVRLSSSQENALVTVFAERGDSIMTMGEASLEVKTRRTVCGVHRVECGRMEFVNPYLRSLTHHMNLAVDGTGFIYGS